MKIGAQHTPIRYFGEFYRLYDVQRREQAGICEFAAKIAVRDVHRETRRSDCAKALRNVKHRPGMVRGQCGCAIVVTGARKIMQEAAFRRGEARCPILGIQRAALCHGGADYITIYEFIKAVRARTPTPQDVYDAATRSAIIPLSGASAANHGAPQDFPDFTGGNWKTTPPIPIYGA